MYVPFVVRFLYMYSFYPSSSSLNPVVGRQNRSSAKRLTYDTVQRASNPSTFYSRPALQPVDMNEVYVPESPIRECWQPGQTLPITPPYRQQHQLEQANDSRSSSLSTGNDLQTMLHAMQSSTESNFQDIKGRLSQLEDRMEHIEDKHKQYDLLHVSPASSSESYNEKGRKRRSPPELQVWYVAFPWTELLILWHYLLLQYEIRKVHGSFLEENQLNVEERWVQGILLSRLPLSPICCFIARTFYGGSVQHFFWQNW